MAYLNFDPDMSCPTAPQRALAERSHEPLLGRAERDVLILARRDPRSSLAPPTPLRMFGRRAFGLRGPNPLADPRLEALRRYAVLLRRRGERMAKREDGRLIVEGYTPAQIAEVRRLITLEMAPAWQERQRRRWSAAALIAAATLQALLWRFLTAYLNDGLIGLIFTLVATAAAAPVASVVQRSISVERARPAWSR